jgi:hypothetical protein
MMPLGFAPGGTAGTGATEFIAMAGAGYESQPGFLVSGRSLLTRRRDACTVAPTIQGGAVRKLKLRRPSHGTAVAYAALFVALGGTAYAANTVGSSDIINESILSEDIKDLEVKSTDIANAAVNNSKLKNNAVGTAKVTDESLTSQDLGPDSVSTSEIAIDGVGALEISNNSIDSGEIIDFQLSNQDVGVEFAQINANGTVANSSGGVTATRINTGQYEVDFGHNITFCAFVMTQGEAGAGSAGGAITGATDRNGNAEAVFATVRTNTNAAADRAFQLVVVC